jgi:hypothetical protein
MYPQTHPPTNSNKALPSKYSGGVKDDQNNTNDVVNKGGNANV